MRDYEEEARHAQAARKKEKDVEFVSVARTLTKIVAGALVVLILLIGGCMAGMPKYDLYKAETAKRERIAEAKAEADAADYRAEAEVKRAQREAEADRIRAAGIADAQQKIGSTLTDNYLTWLFIDTLGKTKDQVIYVPTEGGIPILEANRGTSRPE